MERQVKKECRQEKAKEASREEKIHAQIHIPMQPFNMNTLDTDPNFNSFQNPPTPRVKCFALELRYR